MTRYRDKGTGEVVEVKPQPFGLYKRADDGEWLTADDFRERFEPVEQQGKEV